MLLLLQLRIQVCHMMSYASSGVGHAPFGAIPQPPFAIYDAEDDDEIALFCTLASPWCYTTRHLLEMGNILIAKETLLAKKTERGVREPIDRGEGGVAGGRDGPTDRSIEEQTLFLHWATWTQVFVESFQEFISRADYARVTCDKKRKIRRIFSLLRFAIFCIRPGGVADPPEKTPLLLNPPHIFKKLGRMSLNVTEKNFILSKWVLECFY